LRIIPVLDLKQGIAVHAVAGQRDRYAPLQSIWSDSADPVDVALNLRECFGFEECYVADLDAIAGNDANAASLIGLAEIPLKLWVDVGVKNSVEYDSLQSLIADTLSSHHIVLGFESLASEIELVELCRHCDRDRVAFSLDLFDGKLWTDSPGWRDWTAESVVARVWDLGIRRWIVLDVAAVGTNQGPTTLSLCRTLRANYPAMELIGGGGVRDVDDLERFAAAGCDGVLVATAIHRGALPIDVVRKSVQEWRARRKPPC
jgi:phosphoribosylformimino-5-aminoimidazole carboxamide ribotide isomerase